MHVSQSIFDVKIKIKDTSFISYFTWLLYLHPTRAMSIIWPAESSSGSCINKQRFARAISPTWRLVQLIKPNLKYHWWYLCKISLQIVLFAIGHFRVHLSLHFKARLSAKLWKSVFIHIEIGTNYHNKSFALRLALKERLRGTRKCPICS